MRALLGTWPHGLGLTLIIVGHIFLYISCSLVCLIECGRLCAAKYNALTEVFSYSEFHLSVLCTPSKPLLTRGQGNGGWRGLYHPTHSMSICKECVRSFSALCFDISLLWLDYSRCSCLLFSKFVISFFKVKKKSNLQFVTLSK